MPFTPAGNSVPGWRVFARVVPNRVCTAVNLADEVTGVRNGRVETVWPVLARGKRT